MYHLSGAKRMFAALSSATVRLLFLCSVTRGVGISNLFSLMNFPIHSNNATMHVTYPRYVGPCHHSLARPQVDDEGTTSNMKGSCEYI